MNKSLLITRPGIPISYTGDQETDARTALTRGLAEYLARLVFKAPGGRELRFNKVLDTWAEPEDEAHYPRAYVGGIGEGTYDSTGFTPDQPTSRNKLPGPPDGRYLVSACALVQDLTVEVWANDPPARRAIVAGLETAFNPVDYMSGFFLELPFYFNSRARYSLKGMAYLDNEQDAMRRYRKAAFTIAGEVPVMNIFTYPLAKPSFHLDEVGPDVVIPGLVLTDC
jgi:hypothetical protein